MVSIVHKMLCAHKWRTSGETTIAPPCADPCPLQHHQKLSNLFAQPLLNLSSSPRSFAAMRLQSPTSSQPNLHFRSAAQPNAWDTIWAPFHNVRWRIPYRPLQTHSATPQGRSLQAIDRHWSKNLQVQRQTFRPRHRSSYNETKAFSLTQYRCHCRLSNGWKKHSRNPYNTISFLFHGSHTKESLNC